MNEAHSDMVTRASATGRVLDLRETVLSEHRTTTVELGDLAGRVLADAVVATADQPPHSYATMDGFAFDATDPYPLELRHVGVYPEDDPPALGPGEAVPIATGAPLPEAASAVLKREEATVEDSRLRGPTLEPGTYVYGRGSNVESGETLFTAGERLTPKDALLLGDLGHDTLSVYEPFRVALLATGTEIHEGRWRDLDSPMLASLIRRWGHEATYEGTVPDEYDRVVDRIEALATEYDIVVTTGGTSVGKKDHVVRALDDLGKVLFHRVRVRPGKPIAVARLPAHDAVAFAIPGKPVGAHTVTMLLARPFFIGDRYLPSVSATLARSVGVGASGFEYVVPVTLDDGEAMPLGHVDSPLQVYEETFDPSVLSSSTRASRADGFFITETAVDGGETVGVVPYPVVE